MIQSTAPTNLADTKMFTTEETSSERIANPVLNEQFEALADLFLDGQDLDAITRRHMKNESPEDMPLQEPRVSDYYKTYLTLERTLSYRQTVNTDQIKQKLQDAKQQLVALIVKERGVQPLVNVRGLVCTTNIPAMGFYDEDYPVPADGLDPIGNIAENLGYYYVAPNTKVLTVIGADGKKYSGRNVDIEVLKGLGYSEKPSSTDGLKERLGSSAFPTSAEDFKKLFKNGVIGLENCSPKWLERVMQGTNYIDLLSLNATDSKRPNLNDLVRFTEGARATQSGDATELITIEPGNQIQTITVAIPNSNIQLIVIATVDSSAKRVLESNEPAIMKLDRLKVDPGKANTYNAQILSLSLIKKTAQ